MKVLTAYRAHRYTSDMLLNPSVALMFNAHVGVQSFLAFVSLIDVALFTHEAVQGQAAIKAIRRRFLSIANWRPKFHKRLHQFAPFRREVAHHTAPRFSIGLRVAKAAQLDVMEVFKEP